MDLADFRRGMLVLALLVFLGDLGGGLVLVCLSAVLGFQAGFDLVWLCLDFAGLG